MSRYVILAIALLLAGCKSAEKPVPLDQASASKLELGGTATQRFVPIGGLTSVETLISNPTDYEIGSISGTLELYDGKGNLADHRDMIYTVFIDGTTGFKGSLLPRSKATASATIPLDDPGRFPTYRFVQKGVNYYKEGADLTDPGHLFAAISRHDPRLISVIERNPDLLKVKDPGTQMLALHQAAATDNIDVVQAAIRLHSGLDDVAMNGYTPLLEALSHGASDAASLLIGAGASVSAGRSQQTALQLACANCSNDVIDALLQKGADPNQGSQNYPSPLLAAVAKGDINLVKVLIKRGAKVNEPNGNFGTMLHTAVATHNPALVQLLIDHGADVNAVVSAYRPLTPLMIAGAKGDAGTIKILLAHGAKPDAKGPSGKTALDYAEQYGNQEGIEALQSAK